jgi:hypothetical protein
VELHGGAARWLAVLGICAWVLCSGPSRASIVFHGVTGDPPLVSYFPLDLSQDIDLNGDGIVDFALVPEELATNLAAPGQSAVFGLDYPPTMGDLGSRVVPLSFGEEIGPLLASQYGPLAGFHSDASQGGYHLLAGMYVLGAPPNQTPVVIGNFVLVRAYVGVHFEIEGQTHYGWIDLENATLGGGAGFKAYGWAYETEPNTPIAAGAVPEPQVPVFLACGAFALSSRSRRRVACGTFAFNCSV